jgi:hypothetical protein
MLPAYAVIRFLDLQLEERAKPPDDYLQTLLSVQSTYICLCQRFQVSSLRGCAGMGSNYTLKTSALDEALVRNWDAVTNGCIVRTLCICRPSNLVGLSSLNQQTFVQPI